MKVVFKKDVSCDFFDHRMHETYSKAFRKWDEFLAESNEGNGRTVSIFLYDGDAILDVPREAVEIR